MNYYAFFFLASFLLMLSFPLPVYAQQYPVSELPVELLTGADAVIREEVKHFEVKNDKEGKLYYRRAVTLLNENSDADELAIYYDDDTKVSRLRAWIYDAQGREVRKLDKDEVRDVVAVDGFSVYQDKRVKYLEAKQARYPYTVVVEYEQSLSGLSFAVFPDWYVPDYDVAVQSAVFQIRLPAGFGFRYQTLNLDCEPAVEADGKDQVYTWRMESLPAVRSEPYGPNPGFVLPRIITAPDQFRIDDYRGGMTSWEAFGQFMNELYAGRDLLPETMEAEVRNITAAALNQREKIETLYEYLQQNMRYVSIQLGIGGWQPFDAAYVSEKKYGDCKALTNFMKAMLHTAGIEAYPALIKAGRQSYEISEDFTSPRFNHVILYIPEEDTWLECTSNNYPAGYIGADNSDRNVLLVTPEGGRLTRTPALGPEDNVETFTIDIDLQADGGATVAVDQQSTGADHEFYRHMAENYPDEERRKWLQRSSSLPAFTLESLEVKAAEDRPVSQLSYRANAPRYASRAGKRLFVPLSGVHPFQAVPPELKQRRLPVVGRRAYVEVDTVLLRLPEGFQLESMPDMPLQVESEFGRYELQVEKTTDQLRFYRRLEVRAGKWPAERYVDFRNFYREVSRAESQQLVLVNKD